MWQFKVNTDDKGVKVYRKDKDGKTHYSTRMSKKNAQGEWISCFLDTHFKNGVVIPDKATIKVNKAIYTFNVGNNGKAYPYIQVLEFEILDVENAEDTVTGNGFIDTSAYDADLPFA